MAFYFARIAHHRSFSCISYLVLSASCFSSGYAATRAFFAAAAANAASADPMAYPEVNTMYFARIPRHPKTGQRLPGVAIMKVDSKDKHLSIFVDQKPDLETAMAEVRRLNEKVELSTDRV